MTEYKTEQFIYNIKNNIPFIFTKFGDGELNSCLYTSGTNCDGEKYTPELGKELIESFKYIVNNNGYIGKWCNKEVYEFFCKDIEKKDIKWCNYHSCLLDKYNITKSYIKDLFLEIKKSNRKKIAIINPLLIKIKLLCNIDNIINIDLHGNFYKYNKIKQDCLDIIKDDKQPLILFAAGMMTKVLIKDLHKKYPEGIYIDIGSCLDWILTKKDSRGWKNFYTYEEMYEYYKELIPKEWDDKEYDNIYEIAKTEIGIHLH